MPGRAAVDDPFVVAPAKVHVRLRAPVGKRRQFPGEVDEPLFLLGPREDDFAPRRALGQVVVVEPDGDRRHAVVGPGAVGLHGEPVQDAGVGEQGLGSVAEVGRNGLVEAPGYQDEPPLEVRQDHLAEGRQKAGPDPEHAAVEHLVGQTDPMLVAVGVGVQWGRAVGPGGEFIRDPHVGVLGEPGGRHQPRGGGRPRGLGPLDHDRSLYDRACVS